VSLWEGSQPYWPFSTGQSTNSLPRAITRKQDHNPFLIQPALTAGIQPPSWKAWCELHPNISLVKPNANPWQCYGCEWKMVLFNSKGHCLKWHGYRTQFWSIFSETETSGRVNVIQHTVGTVPQHTPSQSMAQILWLTCSHINFDIFWQMPLKASRLTILTNKASYFDIFWEMIGDPQVSKVQSLGPRSMGSSSCFDVFFGFKWPLILTVDALFSGTKSTYQTQTDYIVDVSCIPTI
jgi:hypothetical protein